jgi:cyclic pyranopterin phosphate synthase
MKEMGHMDEKGRPKMVDVSGKPETERLAIAKGLVKMQAATFKRIKDKRVEKGDVLAVAQLAGIMAAKQTSHLIPLCHPIPIDEVKLDFALDDKNSAVEIAALTIYDMVKSIDRGARIESIRLVKKSGGKSGEITLE